MEAAAESASAASKAHGEALLLAEKRIEQSLQAASQEVARVDGGVEKLRARSGRPRPWPSYLACSGLLWLVPMHCNCFSIGDCVGPIPVGLGEVGARSRGRARLFALGRDTRSASEA